MDAKTDEHLADRARVGEVVAREIEAHLVVGRLEAGRGLVDGSNGEGIHFVMRRIRR